MTLRSQVRIIGGKWRGRKISFPPIPELRPTPDRVRETLFNWLAPHVRDSVCLDLFTGSGVLGLEALSRGAKFCLALDESQEVVQALQENAQRLGTDAIQIVQGHFPTGLEHLTLPTFDIVFLDPPYRKGYIKVATDWLLQSDCLKKNSLLFIETEPELQPLPIPASWEILRSKQAGQVAYYLVRKA